MASAYTTIHVELYAPDDGAYIKSCAVYTPLAEADDARLDAIRRLMRTPDATLCGTEVRDATGRVVATYEEGRG